MRLNGRYVRTLDAVTDFMAALSGTIVALVTLLISASVLSRELGGPGLPWTLEVTEYSLLYICFLAIPWVTRLDGHVRVDFVIERVRTRSESAYLIMRRVGDAGVALICLVASYYGFKVALDLWERDVAITSILNWPKAPIVVVIPLGFLVTLAQLVRLNIEREHQRRQSSQEGSA